ncbi:replication initiation protein [Mycobacterium phage Sparky]|uniref:Helix-turn-helix DNA binding domain protein n=2 Tax=Caudoviricetes TaxID=2731619 RepID=A0A076GDW6_9CAUD|nr:replication initiation protein [Mycobacterium phage Sparky]AII28225.1 hypothetical protein PBI_SPARKY_81 [Mycobacterium phage Sparky]
MRIRSTKPEFWRSQTIAALDWDTRLVLKALESYVDDNGVGKDSVVIFCADAFPHDLAKSPEVCAKVSRSLDQLAEAGLIVRYTFDGEPLVYVRHWKKWQYIDKPKAGRFPRPDGTMNYRDPVDETICAGQDVTDSEVREVSPKPREDFAKTARNVPEVGPQIQSGEQGNRGTGEQASGGASLESHQGADHVAPPPDKCPRHLDDPNPPSCGACASRRRRRTEWEQTQQRLERERQAAEAAEREAERQRAANCQWCKGTGFRDVDDDAVERCDHQTPPGAPKPAPRGESPDGGHDERGAA